MNVFAAFRRRLGWKLLFSYLVVVVIGVGVLIVTAEFQAPTALARHAARMQSRLGDDPELTADLQASFSAAVSEIVLVAAAAAALAALAISVFTTHRIVGPIQHMLRASQRIAAGDYHERVPAPADDDELGALAQAFNRMATSLAQTEQRRMQLVGDVAHELRTPLSSIRSVMEGLVDGVLASEPQTFQNVQREVARLQRLVHDLEELSRAEARQLALERQPVALAELVRSAAARLLSQYEGKDVRLVVDIPAALPDVQADPARVLQVLLNLLGNALQYSAPGGEVRVRLRREGPMVAVAVQDDGIGIQSDHLPHVFERFYRVDKSRSRTGGGSGVGLTIAKHLVEAHGGRIWAESAGPARGSTFTFSLPTAA